MKKLIFFLILFSILNENALAASPTPKSTVVAKATAKPSAVSTVKNVRKKYVYRKVARKPVAPIPSPEAKWPPANFTSSGSIYAKVPSANELNSYASNSKDISAALKDCEKVTCGAVFLASEKGCNWWQIDSLVTAPSKTTAGTRETLGTLRSLAPGTSAKKVIAVILKSSEPLQDGVTVSGITARCWATARPENLPSNTYTPVPTPSPTTSGN